MQSKSIGIVAGQRTPMQMRREIRYRLDAPTLFSWESADHKRRHGEGTTRDLSVLGAFILTPTCPPVDVPIQVEVVLPSLTGPKPVIRVGGTAHVLRVERSAKGEGKNGFAVVSEDFSRWTMSTDRDDTAFADTEQTEAPARSCRQ
jgi:hypothetical protein